MNTDNENEIPYIQEADEYQAFAVRTMAGDYKAIGARFGMTGTTCGDNAWPVKASPFMTDLLHAAMGIATESGEFFDPIKKHLMYGKEIDRENLAEELGDLLWYIAIGAEALETSLSALMTDNIKKLAKRYPERVFTENAAIQRADKIDPLADIKQNAANASSAQNIPLDVTTRRTKCPECGGNDFTVTPNFQAPPDVLCKECGTIIE